jgi:hypothetical protein
MFKFFSKLTIFFIFSTLFISCGGNAEKTETLLVNFKFSNNETCTTYLADKYLLTLYNSKQEKYTTKEIDCKDNSTAKLQVKEDKYYITVELKDSNNNTKSFGSGIVDTKISKSIDITMQEYKGGITLSWNKEDCEKYDLGLISISIEVNNSPLKAKIWGKETTFDKFKINCSAETLLINNIESGTYSLNAFGFKNEQSTIARISYLINDFKLITGQESFIDLDKHMQIEVSDIIIPWNFDSRSIKSCEDAGIEKIKAKLTSDSNDFETTINCMNLEKNILFYDIPQSDYKLTVSGVDKNGKTILSAQKNLKIEKGHIGKNSIKEDEILLK